MVIVRIIKGSKMRYILAIHHEQGTAYGVTVPDIPGCFSAGDTFDEAFENAVEAIHGHLTVQAEDGETAPVAKHLEEYVDLDDYKGAIWGVVDIDITPYNGKSEKLNVTLPTIVTAKIQEEIDSGRAKNRSALLAEAALEKLAIS